MFYSGEEDCDSSSDENYGNEYSDQTTNMLNIPNDKGSFYVLFDIFQHTFCEIA